MQKSTSLMAAALCYALSVGAASAQTISAPAISPAGPTTIGGINSITCATHTWLNTISISGMPICFQPGVGDISGWGTNVGPAVANPLNASGGLVGFSGNIGSATGVSLALSGQLTSTLPTGTSPFAVASTTNVPNLNASSLNGATFAAPGAIGAGTPGSVAATTLSASGAVSGAGFAAYLASPPAIGGATAAPGTFTTLNATTYNGGALSGTFSGTPTLSGANFISRANLAQVAAASLSGNPTGALANEMPVTLGATLSFVGSALQTGTGTGDVAWAANGFATIIQPGVVTNSKMANSASGATFKGNPNASGAVQQDFTLASLPALTSPSATLDLLPCVDHTTGTIKSCTPGAIATSAIAGVSQFNTLTGNVTTSVVVQTFTTAKSTTVSITAASPAVVTWANTLSAGQWVEFTAGTLPTGLSLNTPYCVVSAGLSTGSFEIALTCGGSAINTTGSSGSGITGVMAYVPTPGMLHAIGECLGAGGGSGGTTSPGSSGLFVSGGAGAGSPSRKYLTAASVGSSQPVTVGAGGTAGASGANAGGNGGSSSIGSLCIANGGNGSPGSSGIGAGGAGASAGTGDIAGTGESGSVGETATGTSSSFSHGGRGGSTSLGGGGSPTTGTTNQAAVAGTGFGSGAAGGVSSGSTGAITGAPGQPGIAIITEYVNL